MKFNKFRAQRITHDSYSFASKLEAAVYAILKNDPEVEIKQVQEQVHLTDAKILYKPDFTCQNKKTKEIFRVEAKGFPTPEWKIKLRLWRHYGPSKLWIYMGSHTKPYLDEIVEGKETARDYGL